MNSPAGHEPLVLIVDDDFSMRLQMGAALNKAGLRTREACSGAEALHLFEKDHPQAILLDVLMPEMDGFETCRRLRRLPAGAHVPILMVTGLDDLESVHQAFDAGATDFVSKPITWVLLGYRVRYALRSNFTYQKLLNSKERLAKTQQIARLGDWEYEDASGLFTFSPEALRLLDMPMDARPQTLEQLIERMHPEDRTHVGDLLRMALERKSSFSFHFRLPPDGKTSEQHFFTQGEFFCDLDTREERLVGTIQDVSEQKNAEDRIRFLAFFDSLTSLPNRFLFHEHLEQALAQAQREGHKVALFFLDLDRFKRINDTLGHNIGDKLLQEIGMRLRSCLRKTDILARPTAQERDILLSRLGGDEFTLIANNVNNPEDMARVAKRIISEIEVPLEIDGYPLNISASIGISIYPSDGMDAATLLRNADTAMYSAKEKGRGTFTFYQESMNAAAMQCFKLEHDLGEAITREEFLIYYQPKIDLRTGNIHGAEALIRWRHPSRGLVMPCEFIALAEETGLIIPMTRWLLKTACRQIGDWDGQHGLNRLRVSVNLSGHPQAMDEAVGMVREALEHSGIDPGLLEVELTESILMRKAQSTIECLEELKKLGVGIAIDDFGTGYSSLSYLKYFPVDTLKIDRSFISDIGEGPRSAALVKAIIAMAESLGMTTLAEGVETQEQAVLLEKLGCEQGQGYLFGRPVPVDRFVALVIESFCPPPLARRGTDSPSQTPCTPSEP